MSKDSAVTMNGLAESWCMAIKRGARFVTRTISATTFKMERSRLLFCRIVWIQGHETSSIQPSYNITIASVSNSQYFNKAV